MLLCHFEFLNNSTIPTATSQCLLVFVISSFAYPIWSFHPDLGSLVVFLSHSWVVGWKSECTPDADGLDEQWECGSLLPSQSFIFAHAARNPLGSGVLYSIKAILPEEKRALCDWTLAKCFKGFLLCGPRRTVQASQTLSWRRQMGQMTPPGPLELCFIWMLESVNLRVIFDLQLAFVFNFLYTVKPCTQQTADLAVLGAHRVICLGHTVIPDGCIWNSFITITLGGLKFQVCDSFLGSMMIFSIPILDIPVLKFLWVNFQRTK